MAKKKTKRKASPCVVPVPANARYEPDENPKRKHHWDKNEPGFVEDPRTGIAIGKCPANVDNAQAEQILRSGVGFNPPNYEGPAKNVYCVHLGTVYCCAQTNVATPSYHGYPELRRRLPPSRDLARQIVVRAQAEGEDSATRVMKWLDSKG